MDSPSSAFASAAGSAPAVGDEISLDPDDWSAFGAVAHRALDDAIALLRTVRDRPVWRTVPAAARREIARPVPEAPSDLATVYERFRHAVLPFGTGNIHPRFWGWVMGTGTADAMIADLLASAMNPHLGGYDQSPSLIEQQVIDWWLEIMGYGPGASGLLVSGGTAANLTGLVAARTARAGFDVRAHGLAGAGEAEPARLTVYASTETHSWLEKCCELIGLGRAGIRRVASGRDGRVDLRALRRAVRADRAAGAKPFCAIGNAGTVDAGATDDLDGLADVCAAEDLWLHVDGAFGALAMLSPRLRPLLRGLERSDSLAFDLHKWGYLPYEVGCALVKDGDAHRAAFATEADYLRSPGRGIQPTPLEFANRGIQLSRGFRALKVWMALQVHGTERIGRVIEQNVDQARYLAARVDDDRHLERLAPVPLNVVCFRYRRPDGNDDEAALERLNREILLRLQEEGIAVISSTRREGRFALRLAITNHRSRRRDFDILLDAVLRIGDDLSWQGC